jgi:hypothetical protein
LAAKVKNYLTYICNLCVGSNSKLVKYFGPTKCIFLKKVLFNLFSIGWDKNEGRGGRRGQKSV